ncbi:hypothetical protein [Legionella londiniensis]|uniref:DUF5638 domain-containing protein n=1 Tax=Legionella londiniensis TaxID=45068 RepID=A0A0W0VKH7_9GAMM|nr:hypothetical protein [Legionella londiniensis]KTD20588.1 hypothetical protein Llon_1642 [Legionella londiniensis]
MFHLYTPGFFPTPYEEAIRRKLRSEQTVLQSTEQYKNLLDLKYKASNFRDSIVELRQILSAYFFSYDSKKNLLDLEKAVNEAIVHILNDEAISQELKNRIINHSDYLSRELMENKFLLKSLPALNLAINGLTCGLALTGVFVGATMIASGPILPALLGLAYMVISAAVALCTFYSAMVEGRLLANKQIQEINELKSLLVDGFQDEIPNSRLVLNQSM